MAIRVSAAAKLTGREIAEGLFLSGFRNPISMWAVLQGESLPRQTSAAVALILRSHDL